MAVSKIVFLTNVKQFIPAKLSRCKNSNFLLHCTLTHFDSQAYISLATAREKQTRTKLYLPWQAQAQT